jgi:hypothetical protein
MRHGLTGHRSSPPGSHLQGVDHQLGSYVVGDGPAHDHAAVAVEHDRDVHLALGRGVLGHVHHPQAVRLSWVEAALDQVLGRLGARVTTGAALGLAPVDPDDAGLAHEALDPLAAAAHAPA